MADLRNEAVAILADLQSAGVEVGALTDLFDYIIAREL